MRSCRSTDPRDFCCWAADVPNLEALRRLLDKIPFVLQPRFIKIGLELYCDAGEEAIKAVLDAGMLPFVDLKLHDTPKTVGRTVAVMLRKAASLLTVHVCGGDEMLMAAMDSHQAHAERSATPMPKIIGVTMLTSHSPKSAARSGFNVYYPDSKSDMSGRFDLDELVYRYGLIAQRCGLHGAVASPHEAAMLRKLCGPDFFIITPGMVMPGGDPKAQKRYSTPGNAVTNGSDLVVLGSIVTRIDGDVIDVDLKALRWCYDDIARALAKKAA